MKSILDMFLNENKTSDDKDFIHNKYGYCYYEFDSRRQVCLIFNLHVEKEYRRKGHAEHILKLVINEIRNFEKYTGKLYIEADPEENSISKKDLIRFYERMGFIIVDRKWIDKYINDKGDDKL